MKRFASIALLFCTCACALGQAWAQAYPSGPIRLVVPFPAGGSTDVMARIVGQKITEATGAAVVIDNRGGASGIVGAEVVAKAKPDGYTLLFASNGILTVNPTLFRKLPYDALKDYALVTRIGSVPNMLVVHPSLGVNSLKELIALAKSKPGALNYGSSGAGGVPFLAMETFKYMAGLNIVEIPYKGATPLTTDLVAGQVSMTITGIPAVQAHVKSGRLRALAISTAQRSPAVPDLPTMSELGLQGFDVSTWFAVVAPAGTPDEITSRLRSVISAGIRQPDLTERLASEGFAPDGGSAEELRTIIQAETAKWRTVLTAAGVKPQ